MSTTATTRLEAVNIMLSALGESPVSTLVGNASASVAMAQAILDEVDKEVQGEKWHFNSEDEIQLVPDVNGEIAVPNNYIRVDAKRVLYPSLDITVRGGKLYDRIAHTSVFTSPVKVDVVMLLSFEDLPEAARQYIITRAARKLLDRVLGAQEHHAYNMRDEAQARARLMDFDSDTGDYSIFDNYDTARVIDRRYPERGTF